MKKYILVILLAVFSSSLYAQPWTKLLPKNKKGEYTLSDYQKAFYTYWEPYDVDYGKYTDSEGNVHRAPGWKQFKRWEWNMEHQVDAQTGKFPDSNPAAEYKKWAEANPKAFSKTADWQPLGPYNSSGGYAGVGRINTIAFHPSDNNTYWIAAPAGGLWQTTDNGSSWTCLTDDNPVLGISDIVIPSDYETSGIIYIATGDRDGWDNNSLGVLKSTDYGQTWQNTDLSFSFSQERMTSRLLLDPNDDQTIIAATSAGVFKTTDGGLNWNTNLSSIYFIDMEYKPGDYSVLYGSTTGGNVFMSNDAGATWTQVLSLSAGRVELAVSPANADVVYAIVGAGNNGLYGIYKSINSGQNFSQVFDGTIPGNNLLDWYSGDDTGGQAWYDLSIAASPVNADVLLVGGINTWRSQDGGENWDIVNHWWGNGVQAVHADKHMLKYRSNGDLFECNDGGVYISSDNGSSGSWTDKTGGMMISQMYKLGASQTTPDDIITGLQDNGTKSLRSGAWMDVIGGDGMECAIDHTDEDVQYGSLYYGALHRTTDKWDNSNEITPTAAGDGAWVTPFVLDPNNNETIYAGYGNIWKSENRGNSWYQISNIGSSSKFRSMAVAPSNSDIIYAADLYTVWKTDDGGASWENVSTGLPSNTKTYIAVKDNDPQKVWVTLGGYDSKGIYESADGGDTWTNISEGLPELPVYTVVQNKIETSEENLYVGTEVGVYIKQGDAPWVAFNNGLPNVKIGEIDMHYNTQNPPESKLIAATYGRGLWQTTPELSGAYAPAVNTGASSNISFSGAVLAGNIVNDFGSNIIESGIIISVNPNPTFSDPDLLIVPSDPTATGGLYSVTVSDLEAGTPYYYRAYAENGNGSGLGGTETFVTNCMAQADFPWTEDFENAGELPLCWENELVEGDVDWIFKAGNQSSIIYAHSGQYNALLKDTDGDDDIALLKLPTLNFAEAEQMNLSFWYSKQAQWPNIDNLAIVYKPDGAAQWDTLSYITDDVSEWTQFFISLPEQTDNYQIGFLGNAKYGRGITIDDVTIDFLSSSATVSRNMPRVYPNPTNGTVYLDNTADKAVDVKLFNSDGKRLIDMKNFGKDRLDLSAYPTGVYILNITFDSKTYSQQLIVK